MEHEGMKYLYLKGYESRRDKKERRSKRKKKKNDFKKRGRSN
jgi:hypothetical protein